MSDEKRIDPASPTGGRLTGHKLIIAGEHARELELNEGAVDAFQQQRARFVEKFGREPGPGDPVFFDPDEDEPTSITPARHEQMMDEWQANVDAAGIDVDVRAALDRRGEQQRAIQEEHGISRKIGRNDPCPCGSGLKFKRCHGDR